MAEILIAIIVIICTIKTVSYGIFTLRGGNVAGFVMIILMSAASLASLFVLM